MRRAPERGRAFERGGKVKWHIYRLLVFLSIEQQMIITGHEVKICNYSFVSVK